MKKKLLISYFFILLLFTLLYSTYASTNVRTRTSDNLYVNKNISITASKKQIILNTPSVDASEKIYDFANLFSEGEEIELYDQAQKFIEKENLDIAIVTISTNNKTSSMAYADDFYDYNDFGIGDDSSGILLLIDMDKRNIWISTTGEAIEKYSDSKIDNMLDKIQPCIKNKNYYEGAKEFINYSDSRRKQISLILFIIGIILSAIIASAFCGIFALKHKPVKLSNNANNYLDKSSINITNRKDIFVSTYTSKTVIETSSGGGGSSTHSGSSGISHGGGGRSF